MTTTKKPKTVRIYVANVQLYLKKISHQSAEGPVWGRELFKAGETLPANIEDLEQLRHFLEHRMVTAYDIPIN